MLTICFAISLYILKKAGVRIDYLSQLIVASLVLDFLVFAMVTTLIQIIFA